MAGAILIGTVGAPPAAWAQSDTALRTRTYRFEIPAERLDIALARVWIATDGGVERIDFTQFAHEEANADLRAAIVGRRLAAPPPNMLLPLRLSIQLEPAVASAPSGPMVADRSRGTAGIGA